MEKHLLLFNFPEKIEKREIVKFVNHLEGKCFRVSSEIGANISRNYSIYDSISSKPDEKIGEFTYTFQEASPIVCSSDRLNECCKKYDFGN